MLRFVFLVARFVLVVLFWLWSAVNVVISAITEAVVRTFSRAPRSRKRLVIVGGGFSGCLVAKSAEHLCDVTLVAEKPFFEFTPSVPIVIRDPRHTRHIQVPLSSFLDTSRTCVVEGSVSRVDTETRRVLVGPRSIEYDLLLISSGTSYNEPFKTSGNVIMANRSTQLASYSHALRACSSVLVVGGGAVGVETAAELAFAYPEKHIVLAHSGDRLLSRSERIPDKAREYAHNWLVSHGVDVQYNTRINTAPRADSQQLVILCTGVRPNSSFIDPALLDERGYVLVDKYMRVRGAADVYAAGDVTSVREEKLAQTAELHGELVLHNMFDPQNQRAYTPSEGMGMIISLGPHAGVFALWGYTLTGVLPALMKMFVEFKVVTGYKLRTAL